MSDTELPPQGQGQMQVIADSRVMPGLSGFWLAGCLAVSLSFASELIRLP